MRQEYNISVITINFNGLKDTCELLDTLPLEDTSLEVIVVDNASQQDEATVISQRYPQVTVIRSNQNLGFAGGNNLGIQAAHGKYLFFLNNDTILYRGERREERGERKEERGERMLKALTECLESSPHIGMVCPKIRFAWGSQPIQYAGYTPLSRITLRNRSIGFGEEDHGQYDEPHPTPYAHGAAMMVKREIIEKVGMMPECYFLYYEELDWSLMFRRTGYNIWYEPACTIYHKESQSTGQQSALRTYYITRNRLLFVQRNNHLSSRYLSYLYLLTVVALKDIAKYLCQCRPDLAKATLRGISDFICKSKKVKG